VPVHPGRELPFHRDHRNPSAVGPGELLFLLPCFAILIFGGWLAVAELRMRRRGGRLV
jgi:hypothetical protein